MAETPLSRIYANALIELADEHGATERVSDDFDAFWNVWKDNESIRRFLSSPAVSRERKIELVGQAGGKLHDDFRRFLGVLCEKDRISILPQIYDSFSRMLEERGGLVRARATFAVCMEEKTVSELEAVLAEKLGKKVSLWVRQDPSILGGMVLQIGDRRVDASLQRKLEEFRRASSPA